MIPSNENPFKDYLSDLAAFEAKVRRDRAVLHARKEDIAIDLLKQGHTVRTINGWLGTKNPNWIYEACTQRGLGTPGQVRERALADSSLHPLQTSPVPGGYLVTSPRTDEQATFIWEPEANAYAPKDSRVVRGSALYDVVRRFGQGLLPFPYDPDNPTT